MACFGHFSGFSQLIGYFIFKVNLNLRDGERSVQGGERREDRNYDKAAGGVKIRLGSSNDEKIQSALLKMAQDR